mmetsp:Transcript_95088/g.296214  ORF Transcript_95088/g.296214 Transcript_95088/m.296214 type:complete len:262 (-) Transcript_95088:39-824(-)
MVLCGPFISRQGLLPALVGHAQACCGCNPVLLLTGIPERVMRHDDEIPFVCLLSFHVGAAIHVRLVRLLGVISDPVKTAQRLAAIESFGGVLAILARFTLLRVATVLRALVALSWGLHIVPPHVELLACYDLRVLAGARAAVWSACLDAEALVVRVTGHLRARLEPDGRVARLGAALPVVLALSATADPAPCGATPLVGLLEPGVHLHHWWLLVHAIVVEAKDTNLGDAPEALGTLHIVETCEQREVVGVRRPVHCKHITK